MSLAPFANLEQRLNRAVIGRLANAVAVVGGVEVPVLFRQPYAAPFGGEVDASAPECTGPVAGLGELERGGRVTIDSVAYEVLTAEPNGSGVVRLVLGTA